jgi:hypothetical protein
MTKTLPFNFLAIFHKEKKERQVNYVTENCIEDAWERFDE